MVPESSLGLIEQNLSLDNSVETKNEDINITENFDFFSENDTEIESDYYLKESEISGDNIDEIELDNKIIYLQIKMTRSEFINLFEATTDKMALPESNRNVLYNFIQLLLPSDSNIPKSYYLLKKDIKFDSISSSLLCSFCKNDIDIVKYKDKRLVKNCITETCSNFKRRISRKNSIKLFNANIEDQIKNILNNNFDTIFKYQEKIRSLKQDTIVDISSGEKFNYSPDTISLILFIDSVNYTKSNNFSQWFLLSQIVELPPILRGSYENIIFHSSWSGPQFDFNFWFKNYNQNVIELLDKGIEWSNEKINIAIHGFISDAPARSKACNCVQFNGYFRCIKCFHPGKGINRVIVYPTLPNILNRTASNYSNQVRLSLEQNVNIEGIKGFSYLSKMITLPDDICALLNKQMTYFTRLNEFETKHLFENLKLINYDLENETLFRSHRATTSTFELHSFEYDQKFESLNNHTVEYLVDDRKFIGKIVAFFEIRQSCMALVQMFRQSKRDDFF
ncbi:unnamed protein product [Brachionus calyciflorus]|uniref:Uncharacterized protein n=1 Tax=Brachionus calyciflorus TaxID=104777 RepID=A0A814IMA7_9BILA|nr:unnamed protein product [Brachionus calyciflorus]